jgi:hypothetical protein
MISDKRLLGKREKCSYMYEDLNMDSVAIDLNHDLIVDKRKHTRNGPKDDESELSSCSRNDTLLETDNRMMRIDDTKGSLMAAGSRRTNCLIKGTLVKDRDRENGATLKTSILQKGQNMPAKVIGLPVVTPLTAFNSNTIQIRASDERLINRIGQPLSSFGHSNHPIQNSFIDSFNLRWTGSRGIGLGMDPEGYSQGYCFAPKMNSLRFQRMPDISLDELDAQFADGQIFVQSSLKFRSVKGVLFQIMDEIEEYELLLK